MTDGAPRAPRFRRLPRAVREEQMLDAAVSVFSRRGFHAASMDEVAEAADISKPMLYAYLGSKDQLFSACIRRETGRLVGAIADAVEPGLPPDEQLWRGLRAFFAYVAEHRDSWAVLYLQARAQGQPFADEVQQMRARTTEVVAALLAGATAERTAGSGGAQRELAALAHALVGAGESLAEWLLTHPDEQPEVAAARLMNFAWMGFGDLLDGRRWHPAEDEPPAARVSAD